MPVKNVYCWEVDDGTLCFYESNSHEEYKDFVEFMESGKPYAIINAVRCENKVIVGFINVPEEKRGMGVGTKLMKSIQKWSTMWGAEKVTLDDCSDRFRKKNNLYIKCGFKYISKGHPEMSWAPSQRGLRF